jgi:hypothetical protein
MNADTPVYYVPGRPGIIDTTILQGDVYVGCFSKETLPQIAKRYPGAALGELGPVSEQSENYYRSPPVEITLERYIEMLEVLPPVDWVQIGDADSFKLSEHTSGNITAIFCRIGARCFALSDSVFTKHEAIVELCRMSMERVRNLQCCCCGGSTKGRQWWNRDTGYGLCEACADKISARETKEQMRQSYGIAGIHYGIQSSEKVPT